jgi:S-adenosylmethionine:tRNA ribosyltransferase-isomerase
VFRLTSRAQGKRFKKIAFSIARPIRALACGRARLLTRFSFFSRANGKTRSRPESRLAAKNNGPARIRHMPPLESVLLSDFDYHLPEELIAQQPLADRAASRMLVVDRATGTFTDRQFRDLPSCLRSGDCLVLNDSRVFPSRLYGTREHGANKLWTGRVEIFLTRQISDDGLTWEALVRPGRKMRTGERVFVSDELSVEILGRGEFGERLVRLIIPKNDDPKNEDVFKILDRAGHVPLPPYIRRADTPDDRDRYQTVFARERGSVAAPTAGLHFTPQILEACRTAGAQIARVTLHVGLGTFQPLHDEVIEQVHLHAESFDVPEETIRAMDAARRVIAIGTTSVRAIESQARRESASQPITGEDDPASAFHTTRSETDLFIYPGFEFRRTGAMVTNFHLPRSSLLVLVCAFAGRELTLAAYQHAVERRYRFFSYGDCMLIV